ncbi:peptidoglycan-binding domain-containing protein [Shouchella lehensis]|nr:peptidoglycan-binding protein [Shouchella lehensis]MBG9783130.1 hypothetical protein [Shouchella lehensis]
MAFEQTVLRKGDRGRGVQTLQRHLIRDDGSVLTSNEDNGEFDVETEDAVKAFQGKHSDLVVDGIAGPATQARLISVNSWVGGEQGAGVRMLQEALNRFTINVGIDGIYGPETTEGVRTFQTHNAIQADGYAGAVTFDTLDKALNVYYVGGERTGGTIYTSVIRMVQSQLIDAGHEMSAGIDGNYGSQTEQAVRDFQEENDLAVDGVAGPRTMRLLDVEATQLMPNDELGEALNGMEMGYEQLSDARANELLDILENNTGYENEINQSVDEIAAVTIHSEPIAETDQTDVVALILNYTNTPNIQVIATFSEDDELLNFTVIDVFGDLHTDMVTMKTFDAEGENVSSVEEMAVDLADQDLALLTIFQDAFDEANSSSFTVQESLTDIIIRKGCEIGAGILGSYTAKGLAAAGIVVSTGFLGIALGAVIGVAIGTIVCELIIG